MVKPLVFYRTLSIFLVFLLLSILVGVKFVANSASVTAASRLYPVKLAAEGIILHLAEPDDRAKIQAFQLKQRVVELRSLELRLAAPELINSTRTSAEATIRSIQDNLQFIKSPAERGVIQEEVELSRTELAQ